MYYECGYQVVKGCEKDKVMRPVQLLHMKLNALLYIMGDSKAVDEAELFIRTQLDCCDSSASEFALHFACEGLFGVRIVRLAPCSMTA